VYITGDVFRLLKGR
jgi:hypothetical protein